MKESRDKWDLTCLAHERGPQSNAEHMDPKPYIEFLRKTVCDYQTLLDEIDAEIGHYETRPSLAVTAPRARDLK